MNETVDCACCGQPMPAERLELGFAKCIECQNEQPYLGFQVFPHKTCGDPILIKGSNKEAIRQADRANRRSR